MILIALSIALAPAVVAAYAYVVYPAALWLIGRLTLPRPTAPHSADWPTVTVTLPVFNAAPSLRRTLDGLVALDYPRERLQLLVISDASTDGSDEIVREYASRGVELLRVPERRGKTAAENAAVRVARGEIIVNVDATVVVPPPSLRALVRAFDDPTVGVASGRDVSVGEVERAANSDESRYVGYEMWVRSLETRIGSIVGASGCFYGFRRVIHGAPLPPELSWDFASALVAREMGFRSVSVEEAVCIVPRTSQVGTELRRKVRTMARGLSTLFYKGALMNPFRYGGFALMLISHKLLRWVPYLIAPISAVAMVMLAFLSPWGLLATLACGAVFVLGLTAIRRPSATSARFPRMSGFAVAVCVAGALAWFEALRGARLATWDPTPRPGVAGG
jgi:cellulose synthase/poly-beta-1,6-N-acetylglucosamine synthase-like glycosyltransferase